MVKITSKKVLLVDKFEKLRNQKLSQSGRQDFYKFVKENEQEIQCQYKWRQLGLPEQVLYSAPDCVRALVESHIAHLIVLFEDTIALDHDDHPIIRVQDQWVRWENIKSELKNYVYIAQDGLVQREKGKIYPIKQLKSDEREKLLRHAQQFWQTHPEVDTGLVKNCVLQIFTTQIDSFSRNWLTANYLDLAPRHVGIRLIDSTGRLYSFGLQINAKFQEFFNKFSWSILASGFANVTTPDFYETRYFDKRRVTSIPITESRLQSIIACAESINQEGGTRFCQLQPNCLSFVKKIIKLAGIDAPASTTVSEMILHAIPGLSRITHAFFMPPCCVIVARLITGLIMSLFLGATTQLQPAVRPLIATFSDILSEKTYVVDHVYKLLEWQQKHAQATQTFFYRQKPELAIFKT